MAAGSITDRQVNRGRESVMLDPKDYFQGREHNPNLNLQKGPGPHPKETLTDMKP